MTRVTDDQALRWLPEPGVPHTVTIVEEVRARLEHNGGWAELYHLGRMSSDELDLLRRRELGL